MPAFSSAARQAVRQTARRMGRNTSVQELSRLGAYVGRQAHVSSTSWTGLFDLPFRIFSMGPRARQAYEAGVIGPWSRAARAFGRAAELERGAQPLREEVALLRQDLARATDDATRQRLSQDLERARATLDQQMNRARALRGRGWTQRRAAAFGLPGFVREWITELPSTAVMLGRGAVTLMGLGTAYRMLTGGGGPFTNRYGQTDIAGIPFI